MSATTGTLERGGGHTPHRHGPPPSEQPEAHQAERAATFPGRLLGLDVLRGLLIAAMVVVEIVGTADHPHLAHAPWNGLTVTDVVFPGLLVVSGTGLAFTLAGPADRATWQRAVRRAVALMILGVLIINNAGSPDLGNVRVTGVLQTFAVAGLLATVVVLALRVAARGDRWWPGALMVAVGLGVYQAVWVRAAGRASCTDALGRCSPFHDLDVALFGDAHLYQGGTVAWDPEGVVPMLAATLLVLAGWTVGVLLRDPQRQRWVVAAGLLVTSAVMLAVIAPVLDRGVPVNKRLHTPAFQVATTGWTFMVLSVLTLAFDMPLRGVGAARVGGAVRRVAVWPLETLGRNPLTVYVLAHVLGAIGHANTTAAGTTWWDGFAGFTVAVTGGAWWDDPQFNVAFGFLAVMLVIAAAMRALNWKLSL